MTTPRLLDKTPRPSSSLAGRLQVAGLLTAGAGVLLLFVVGVVTAPVPVGTIMMWATAGFVALVRWRWTPLVGLAATLYLIVGFILNDSIAALSNPAGIGELIGIAALALGLVIALVAGVVAAARVGNR